MAKESKYMDRALRARDPRYARVLGKMGYGTRQLVAEPPTRIEEPSLPSVPAVAKDDEGDDLTALRVAYQDATDRKAYWGWDAETLRAKIAEAKATD